MWKFILAVAVVVGLAFGGNLSLPLIEAPDIHYSLMILPEVLVVFAVGLFLSLR
ncbi:MAG: hypothetical protein ACK5KM_06440 [Hyphomicrobiaceae bacterium]